MANVGAVINNIRNIMRQDRGISGDAQRLEQLGWMLFLKILDDKDKELEITNDNYVSVIPTKFQWRNWAENAEGITGDELLNFIDNYSDKEDEKGLFATLRTLTSKNPSKRAALVQEVFEGNNNYMKSGYEMRKVINKLNEVDFNKSEDKHIFGTIYESILQELRDAGNKGEYYTPRAVTQFMTLMTDPKLGEKVLDPAAGTGGFLTAAIDHVKEKYVRTPDDFSVLQNSVSGWEFKPVAYVLGLTNLILHDVDVPDYEYTDSLKREYNSITNKDRVDVILANPPFGASIAEGVETNFPATYRCRESADLFVVLMMQMLKKNGGRAAIVLPDGSITGDGVKARIREKLLTECNLHTIVRMPQSTFFPATVSTNLLFFEKGTPTKDIWYYEHRLPEGQKSYSKTKSIRFEEFAPLMAWWNDRKESDVAWRVNVKDLKNWDLDIKNPIKVKVESFSSENTYNDYCQQITSIREHVDELFSLLKVDRHKRYEGVKCIDDSVFRSKLMLQDLKRHILQCAISGKLTMDWREMNPNIEQASELIERIKAEKQQLIKIGKLRKEKPIEPIDESELLFNIPSTWEWCRLSSIYQSTSGGTPSRSNSKFWHGDITWYKSGELNDSILGCESEENITIEGLKGSSATMFPSGTLLIAMYGATAGKLAILERNATTNQAVCGLYENRHIDTEYMFYYLMSQRSKMIEDSWGMSQPNISQTYLKAFLVPIAPIDEQKRIVEIIKNSLEKCSLIEAQITANEQTAQNLIKSILCETFNNN